jgi:hypothetical protein
MSMRQVGEAGIHLGWQYIHIPSIWQDVIHPSFRDLNPLTTFLLIGRQGKVHLCTLPGL